MSPPITQAGPPVSGQDVSDVVRWVAYAKGDRMALSIDDATLTYGEFDDAADRLAHCLVTDLAHGGDAPLDGDHPEPRVVLWLSGLEAMMISSVAILRAGMVSVAVDPTTPAARVETIAAQVGARVVLTDIVSEAGVGVRAWDPLVRARQAPRLQMLKPAASLATIVFTSGTTGEPKGILLPANHRPTVNDQVMDSVRETDEGRDLERRKLEENEHQPMLIGMLWAGTVGNAEAQIQRLLITRGTIVAFDIRREGVARLGRWLHDTRVFSCFTIPPTVLRQLLASLTPEEMFTDLKMVSMTGEAARWEDVARLRSHLPPDGMIYAAYGMSETGLISGLMITADTPTGSGALPAGHPAPGRVLRIVDEDGRELPAGEVGEVTVDGADIALGYWRDPQTTARAFGQLADGRRRMRTGDRGRLTDDGALELMGRLDHMVKIAGNRVELGEIEAALQSLDGVAEAAATTYTDRVGALRLVAFAAPAAGALLDPMDLRRSLQNRLPRAYLPDRVELIDSIPQLANGKIDRRSLPVADGAGVHQPPSDAEADLEARLVSIWALILERDEIGLDDDFFALGGDSLRAAAIFAEIEHVLGLDRPVSLLIEAPTIRSLAAALQREDGWSGIAPIDPRGTKEPLFVVHDQYGNLFPARMMALSEGTDHPVFGFKADALSDAPHREESLEQLAGRYVDALAEFRPTGPYQLYGHMVGGLIAFEMALQLQARGHAVGLLVIADISAPPPARVPLARRVRGAARRILSQRRASPPPGLPSSGTVAATFEPPPVRGMSGLTAARRAESAAEHYIALATAYRPAHRFVGRVTLIHGGVQSTTDRGWRQHVRGTVQALTVGEMQSALAADPSGQALARP